MSLVHEQENGMLACIGCGAETPYECTCHEPSDMEGYEQKCLAEERLQYLKEMEEEE